MVHVKLDSDTFIQNVLHQALNLLTPSNSRRHAQLRQIILQIAVDGEDNEFFPTSPSDFPYRAFIEQLQAVAKQFSQITEGMRSAAATCIQFTVSFR